MMWLVGTAFAFLALWLLQLAAEYLSLPRLTRRPPAPHVPHWARTGHLPLPPASPSSAAAGRHRRKATR